MKRIFNYIIPTEYDGRTLLSFLKDKQYSAPIITHLKRTENGILLNGAWGRVRDILHTGDQLTITLIETESSENIVPTNLPLDIVYEDEDILIINKPSNMAIHPSMGNHDGTLANAVMYHFQSKNQEFVFRCVNRLDKDTTGLTIIAKHSLAAAILGKQITNRQIHRTYLAICEGKTKDFGTIDAPIARAENSTIERCVDYNHGETAITNYTLVEYNSKLDLSLVKLRLETGRTHQIRVHMKHIGHPLIGDFLYNPNYINISRQALHSHSLEFSHPITNKKMNLISNLPSDMKFISKNY